MRIIDSPAGRQASEKASTRSDGSLNRDAWTLVGWLGIGFVVMGVIDIALGTYPMAFGNPEWEFGTISGILNGFAIPTMGAYLLLGSLMARQRRSVRILAIAMLVVAVILVLMGLLYATVVPIALHAVTKSDLLSLGIKKAITKAALFVIAYVVLYLVGGIKGWRAGRVS